MSAGYRLEPAQPQAPLPGAPFHEWRFPDGTLWTQFYRRDGGYLLRFPELADFAVSADAADVACRPAPAVSAATAEHLYLNQVLPLVQSKRGQLVFHASAVELAGGAAAFVAESGRGKSTLAAGFASSGLRFLTDDGLVVEEQPDGGFRILPSHPSIRLWEDSEAALLPSGAPAAPALEYTAKSRFLAGAGFAFCDAPRPLRRVYFLGEGNDADIVFQRLSAAEALVEWVKHSFLLDIEEQALLAAHFDQLARLASLPIHYRLDYPRRYEELPRVRQAIIEHAAQGEAA